MNKTIIKNQHDMKQYYIREKFTLNNKHEFEIISYIGDQGGSSTVYKASWLSNNHKTVAVKQIHSAQNDKIYFDKECKALESINNDYPQSAIKLHEYSLLDKVLILDFAESNLGEEIEKRSKSNKIQFDIHEVYTIIYSITEKVKDIHSLNIKHRDIKPQNILLLKKNDFNSIRISDFGTSKVINGQTIHPSSLPMTYAYAPPETLGQNYFDSDDLFSLGMLLYELLEGTDVIPKQKGQNIDDFRQKCIKNGQTVSEKILKKINEDTYNRDVSSLNYRDKGLFIQLLHIASKALHIERKKRYSGALDLFDDIKKANKNEKDSSPSVSKFISRSTHQIYNDYRFPISILISICLYTFLLNFGLYAKWGAHLPVLSFSVHFLIDWFILTIWNIQICMGSIEYSLFFTPILLLHYWARKIEQTGRYFLNSIPYQYGYLIVNVLSIIYLFLILYSATISGPKLSNDDGNYFQNLILKEIYALPLSEKNQLSKDHTQAIAKAFLKSDRKSFLLALPTDHANCFNEYQVAARIFIKAGYYMPDIQQMTQSDLSRAINSLTPDDQLRIKIKRILIQNIENDWGMTFTYIPPVDVFFAGSPSDEANRDHDETLRKIQFKQGFYIQTTEVTQKQWLQIMRTRPWLWQKAVKEGDDFPVVNVSWHDCQEFIKKLNDNDPDMIYRLPDEIEWEYACLANSKTRFHWGIEANREYANMGFTLLKSNSKFINFGNVMKVKSFQPNAFGLFDMHGNVWEWCNNTKKTDSKKRSTKGGSWRNEPSFCRCANRGWLDADSKFKDQGFRLIIVEKGSKINID